MQNEVLDFMLPHHLFREPFLDFHWCECLSLQPVSLAARLFVLAFEAVPGVLDGISVLCSFSLFPLPERI